MKSIQEQVLTADYESCAGYLPGECWGRDTSIKMVGNFSNSIPDMKFDIKEVLVAGDRVIVRGEVTGTPAGELFGAPHTGKSFRMMAIDIQTADVVRVEDGKLAEHWDVFQDGATQAESISGLSMFGNRFPASAHETGPVYQALRGGLWQFVVEAAAMRPGTPIATTPI